jgi:hypothetical protein
MAMITCEAEESLKMPPIVVDFTIRKLGYVSLTCLLESISHIYTAHCLHTAAVSRWLLDA